MGADRLLVCSLPFYYTVLTEICHETDLFFLPFIFKNIPVVENGLSRREKYAMIDWQSTATKGGDIPRENTNTAGQPMRRAGTSDSHRRRDRRSPGTGGKAVRKAFRFCHRL